MGKRRCSVHMEADNTTLESVHCAICGISDETLLFTKDGFRVVRCNSCGLIYINPRPTEEHLQKLYSENYYRISGDGSIGYRNYEEDKQYHAANFKKLLDSIERHKEKGRLLDVGCAVGFLLEEARIKGWDVYGAEMSSYAVNKARQKGLNVFDGDLTDADFKNNFFDVITCLGTIEHLQDPAAAIGKISRILKHDGILVLSTPDAGGLIGGRRFQYKPKEHLYYFTRETIRKMFDKEGLEILFIKREWLRKPLRFVLERLGYYFPAAKSMANSLASLLKKPGILDICIAVPTGQMIVYAKKQAQK